MSLPKKKDPPKKVPPKKDPPKKQEASAPTRPSTRTGDYRVGGDLYNKHLQKNFRSKDAAAYAWEQEVSALGKKWDQSYKHGGPHHAKGSDGGPAKGKSKGVEAKARMSHAAGAKRVNKSHSGLQSPHDMNIKDLFNL